MAEAIFRKMVAESDLHQSWRIESAGTWASVGRPAAEGSRIALVSRGLDLSNHRSRGIDRQYLKSFDLILTMEKGHKEALLVEFPELNGRVFLLSEMSVGMVDVADPIGGSPADYEAAAQKIENYLIKGFEKIVHLAHGYSLQSYEDKLLSSQEHKKVG